MLSKGAAPKTAAKPVPPSSDALGTRLGARVGARVGTDLWPRVISGVVIAAIALAAIWSGVPALAILMIVVSAALAWEWSRVVRDSGLDLVLLLHAAATIVAVILFAVGRFRWGLGCVIAGSIVAFFASTGRHAILSAIGVVVTGLPCLALLWLRGDARLAPGRCILSSAPWSPPILPPISAVD